MRAGGDGGGGAVIVINSKDKMDRYVAKFCLFLLESIYLYDAQSESQSGLHSSCSDFHRLASTSGLKHRLLSSSQVKRQRVKSHFAQTEDLGCWVTRREARTSEHSS